MKRRRHAITVSIIFPDRRQCHGYCCSCTYMRYMCHSVDIILPRISIIQFYAGMHACNSTRANQNSSLVIEIFTDAKDTMKLTFDNNVQHVIMLTVYVNIPLNLTFMTSGSSILHIACRFHNVIYISLHRHTANLSLSHEIRRDSRDASFRQRNL